LCELPKTNDPNLLVGIETADDAAVYRLSDDEAIVTSLDFFPPIVDDAFLFGEITAANAMSDIYAMGGVPRFALSIVCFPKKLSMDVMGEMLRGAIAKLKEAGAVLAGGHSIEDKEVKFGLSVNGVIHPDRIITNKGARAGDVLVLTKPIGVGVVVSALKAGYIAYDEAGEALSSMRELNLKASLVMNQFEVSACTDVTGFGLLGHAYEMAKGSGTTIVINAADVPIVEHAMKYVAKRKCRPRAIKSNKEFIVECINVADGVDKHLLDLLFDPQTSGGLLISIPKERSNELIEALRNERVKGVVVGEVVEKVDGAALKVE
jgi:selenide,water dikinase